MNSNRNELEAAEMRNVDRISSLPDSLISDMILSRLHTKDSFRTSVLSSRWKHLYSSVPFFSFVYNGESVVVSNFLNRLPRITRIEIYSNDKSVTVNNSDIISWIDTITSRYVQDISLCYFDVMGVATPHSLFTCETLVSLLLILNFLLSVPDIVCLPKLKVLILMDILMDESSDESVSRLLSSCPVLETLSVMSKSMCDIRIFNVSVPSLKSLDLQFSHTKTELLINCPNLEELSIRCGAVRGYSGDVLESLKRCDIAFKLSNNEFEDGKLIELVSQVCKVQFLSLNGDSMQALLISSGSIPTFENLTHLELKSDASDGWQLLPSILNSSPRLTTLVFVSGFLDVDCNFGNPFPPPEHVPVCVSNHLKVIKYNRFAGKENEYKWVEYFLTNGLVLEKMEICLWLTEILDEGYRRSLAGESDGEEEEGEGLEEGEEHGHGQEQGREEEEGERAYQRLLKRSSVISKRLLAFQRFSKGCQIVINSSGYY